MIQAAAWGRTRTEALTGCAVLGRIPVGDDPLAFFREIVRTGFHAGRLDTVYRPFNERREAARRSFASGCDVE